MVARAQERPIVFISYAHESDATDQAILALANMLRLKGCEVRTDHPYRDVAPPAGWDKWMEARFREATKLLVVCTPRLKAIYEESDSAEFLPNYGTGVVYEATLVRNYLRQNRARNTKIIPLLPTHGDPQSVPDILVPWCNYLRFPTDNERIAGGVSGAEVAQASGPEALTVCVGTGESELEDLSHPVLDRLTLEEVQTFVDALQAQFLQEAKKGRIAQGQPPRDAAQIVRWLLSQVGEDARNALQLIRLALRRLDPSVRRLPRQELWDAACAVYCLAASRVISLAAFPGWEAGAGSRILELQLPGSCDPAVSGIIALAMEESRSLQMRLHMRTPVGVHDVSVPLGGEEDVQAAQRAVFTTIVGKNARQAPRDSLGARNLSDDEMERLRVVIQDVHSREQVIAVVLRNARKDTYLEAFAKELNLPILLLSLKADSGETAAAVSVAGLEEHMKLFWELLGVVSTSADAQSSVTPPDQEMQRGPDPMPRSRPLPRKIPEHRLDLQRIGNGCDNPDRVLDVVFIHGLDGDAWKSWMTDENDTRTFWPYWIAESFPQAGVFSLGYAASSTKWREEGMPIPARATQVVNLLAVEGIGKRPLAIIAHSMGGLIAKQVLRIAKDSTKAEYQRIARQAKSIVFISTPHSGSSLANLMQLLGAITRPNEQLRELKAHDATLQQLHDWFLGYQRQSQLLCSTYYEQREVRPVWSPLSWFKKGILVVDATSANTGIAGEPAIPLDADHLSICKLASTDAQLYKGVVAMLSRIIDPNAP